MPLDHSRLAAAIRANMLADESIGAVDAEPLTAMCNAIASAVITEITGNAVVVPTLLVAPSGGGPVTGTGAVT
jgi:hypothetical protein